MVKTISASVFTLALAALFANAANAADVVGSFAGTWHSADKQYVLTVKDDGSAILNGDFGPIQNERIVWTNCSAAGGGLTCKWSGTYTDEFKEITRHGTVTAKLDGTNLTGTLKLEAVDKENWHNTPKYRSRAQKDLPFAYTKG